MSLICYGRVTIKIKRKYLFNKLSNTLLNVPFRLYDLQILHFDLISFGTIILRADLLNDRNLKKKLILLRYIFAINF